MVLSRFPLLQDNTRLVRHEDTLYKVKVKYNQESFKNQDTVFTEQKAHNEIEQCIRALLYKIQRNTKFRTIHSSSFIIEPNEVPWGFPKKYSNYAFKCHGKRLQVYDFMIEVNISFREPAEDGTDTSNRVVPVVKQSRNENKFSGAHTGSQQFAQQGSSKATCKKLPVERQQQLIPCVAASDNIKVQVHRFGRTRDGRLFRVIPAETTDAQQSDEHNEVYSNKKVIGNKSNICAAEINTRPKTNQKKTQTGKRPVERVSEKSLVQKNRTPLKSTEVRPNLTKKTKRDRKSNYTIATRSTVHTSKTAVVSVKRKYKLRERNSAQRLAYIKRLRKRADKTFRSSEDGQKSEVKGKGRKRLVVGSTEKPEFKKMLSKTKVKKDGRQFRRESEKAVTSTDSESESSQETGSDGFVQCEAVVSNLPMGDSPHKLQRSTRLSHSKLQKHGKSSAHDTRHKEDKQCSQPRSHGSKAQKIKLYARKHSPLVVIPSTSREPGLTSPQVSTVRPLTRSEETSGKQKATSPPRRTRQTVHQEHWEETARIEQLQQQQQQVADVYRNFLQNRRDRHTVEQAERMEADKLLQLYQPVVVLDSPQKSLPTQNERLPGQNSPRQQSPQRLPRQPHLQQVRQSPRLHSPQKLPRQPYPQQVQQSPRQQSPQRLPRQPQQQLRQSPRQLLRQQVPLARQRPKRKSSGLWGSIMDTLVTPTKKFMFGKPE